MLIMGSWVSISVNGFPLAIMGFHWRLWVVVGDYGFLMAIIGGYC